MKKSILSALSLSMLLLGACQSDDVKHIADQDASISFALGVENAATRADNSTIADGSKVDKLVYEVYIKGANGIYTKLETLSANKESVSFPYNLTLQLAKGQSYAIAFWAQDADCKAYDTSNLRELAVSYDGAKCNDETRDAFFGTYTLESLSSSQAIDVTLTRPFSQINVATTDRDDAALAGLEITHSLVKISDIANRLNVLTGVASQDTVGSFKGSVLFDEAEIPGTTLLADADGDGTAEAYHHLAFNYLLVNDGSIDGTFKALVDVDITLRSNNTATKVASEVNHSVTNVPVRRKWRTNILGSLLTADATIKVSIDPVFANDYTMLTDLSKINAIAKAGGDVLFAGNITGLATEQPLFPGQTFKAGILQNGGVIDGGGNKLTVFADQDYFCSIYTTGGTIKNITIDNSYYGIMTGALTDTVHLSNVILKEEEGKHELYEPVDGRDGNWQYPLIAEESSFYGQTILIGLSEAVFTNCSFGKGQHSPELGTWHNSCLRTHLPTTFINCTFQEKYIIYANKSGDHSASIRFSNCSIALEDGSKVALDAETIKTYIGYSSFDGAEAPSFQVVE